MSNPIHQVEYILVSTMTESMERNMPEARRKKK